MDYINDYFPNKLKYHSTYVKEKKLSVILIKGFQFKNAYESKQTMLYRSKGFKFDNVWRNWLERFMIMKKIYNSIILLEDIENVTVIGAADKIILYSNYGVEVESLKSNSQQTR